MHPEALGGGVDEFDGAVRGGVCPFLNGLGQAALSEIRDVYEQIETGDYEALGELAERLAGAIEQESISSSPKVVEQFDVEESQEKTRTEVPYMPEPVLVQVDLLTPKRDPIEQTMLMPANQQIAVEEDIRYEAQKTVEHKVIEQHPFETVDVGFLVEVERQKHDVELESQQHELPIKDEIPDDAQRVDVSASAASLLPEQPEDEPLVADAVDVQNENVEPLENTQDLAPLEREKTSIVLEVVDEVVSEQETLELNRDDVLVDVELQPSETEHIVSEPLHNNEQQEETAIDDVRLQTPDPEIVATEVIDVYDELVAILYEQDQSQDVEISSAEDLPINDIDKSNQSKNSLDFESYISARPVIEQQPSIDNIREHVNEQTLEQTMLQVAVLISEETESLEDCQELTQVITELQEVVVQYSENGESCPELTPEITEKLVRLLTVLGYDKPSDILTQCVSTHGYLFLWQAIEYVVSQEKKTELGVKATSVITIKNDDIKTRVAKFLFGLISVPNPEPIR